MAYRRLSTPSQLHQQDLRQPRPEQRNGVLTVWLTSQLGQGGKSSSKEMPNEDADRRDACCDVAGGQHDCHGPALPQHRIGLWASEGDAAGSSATAERQLAG